ncbi:unnamed protein product, partial [Rotaria sordida]
NDLKDYFSKFGSIVDVVVMKDRDGQYRGYGFVEFDESHIPVKGYYSNCR